MKLARGDEADSDCSEGCMQKYVLGLIALWLITGMAGTARSAGAGQDNSQSITVRGQIWDSTCAAAGNHAAIMAKIKTTDLKECILNCVKAGAQLVLYNTDDKTTYHLDSQDKVKEYAGQTVTVIGTYDRATGILHVDRVETGM